MPDVIFEMIGLIKVNNNSVIKNKEGIQGKAEGHKFLNTLELKERGRGASRPVVC